MPPRSKEPNHSTFSPSQSSRWLRCPGSLKVHVSEESDASNEGTQAHEIAAQYLKTGEMVNTYNFDEDNMRHIYNYITFVEKFWGETDELFVESKVHFNEIVEGGFGSVDAIIINRARKSCHIFDLKFGRVRVSAQENYQLRFYACGAVEEYNLRDFEFFLHICQPRANNYDHEELSFDQLVDWVKTTVKPGVARAQEPDPPRIAGDKQCEWCSYKVECPEFTTRLHNNTLQEFGQTQKEDHPETIVENVEILRLVEIYHAKEAVENYFELITNRIFNSLHSGQTVFAEWFKLVESRTNRQWMPNIAETNLKERLGKKAYETKLITITAAEKLIPKEEHWLFKTITAKPKGRPLLAPIHDPRPVYQALDVTPEFDSAPLPENDPASKAKKKVSTKKAK